MADGTVVHSSASGDETEAIAAALAMTLRGGDVVLLSGDLGAGKTTFVRGAAHALGVRTPVTSPTFTIGNIYQLGPVVPGTGADVQDPATRMQPGAETGPVRRLERVSHLDLYRLRSLASEEPELLYDYIASDAVAFIEWPAGAATEIEALGRIAYRVELEHAGADRRTITVIRG